MKLWSSPETTSINREPIFNYDHSESILLDGVWDFQLLNSPEDVVTPQWTTIPVPGLWTMQKESEHFWDKPIYTNVQMPFDQIPPAVPQLNPTGIYERDFSIPSEWNGVRYVVQVGGFESVVCLSINGREVGMSKDSRLAADFDITKYVRQGKNRIQIKVIKWSDASFIEDQDQWWHGGITRSVKLYATPSTYLQKLYVTPGLKKDLKTGTLLVRGNVANVDGSYPEGFSVDIALSEIPPVRGSQSCVVPFKKKSESTLEDFAGWNDHAKALFHSEYWNDDLVPPVVKKQLDSFSPTHLAEIRLESDYLVRPWSPEEPNLYSLTIKLKSPDGKMVESFEQKIGFRDTRVVGQQYLFNYKPVIIYGINRHDFHPLTGRVLNREDIRKDLLALKAFNFNGVRTSHYPNDPVLLELADELGFYVISEANIESHAFQDSICSDPRYLSAFVERCARMVERDISHASVIFWSLGNESGSGPNQAAAAAYLRSFDPSRPLHYEGAIRMNRFLEGHDQTDVVCPMYPSISALISYAKSPLRDRPLIICEYSHAMGNSNGTLAEYWEAIHKYEGLQGGFIWEFWDHALQQVLPDGTVRSAYGGDFGEERHDGSFVCDGMFWSNRTPKPAMYEMRAIAAPLKISKKNLNQLEFEVFNKNFFVDASQYTIDWQISVEGEIIENGSFSPGKLRPRGKKQFTVKSKINANRALKGERFITFCIRLNSPKPWFDNGSILGEIQFSLKSSARPRNKSLNSIEVGAILNSKGEIVLPFGAKAPALTLFRAPTENDTFGHIAPLWRKAGLDRITEVSNKVTSKANQLMISRVHKTGAGIEIRHEQLIKLVAGGFSVSEKIKIPKEIKDLPRVGIVMEFLPHLQQLTYFGSGPVETYPDRNLAPITKVTSTVEQQYVPYVVPQESGGHSDVRWIELSDGGSDRIRIELDQPRQASVLPYTADEFERKTHDVELIKSGSVVVTLDAAHRGVGTASCGPDTLPQYLLGPGTYSFSWTCVTDF